MHRWFRICAIFALTAAYSQSGFAEDSKDLAAIRELLEQQNKKIEALTEKVDHLSQAIESSHPTATPAPTSETPVPKAEPVQPTAELATAAAASPTATPDPDQPTHVVKRGENLTNIAHRHGTTVGELLKINKIEDERKLQIGQTLLLPKTSPSPSPSADKTVTPQTDKQ